MNSLVSSLSNIAYTQNGAISYKSTGSKCLDLFSKVGSARNMDDETLRAMFLDSLEEDFDLTLRIMLWVRDCRGGAGERSTFRKLLKIVEHQAGSALSENQILTLLGRVVEIGRWDDIFGTEEFFHITMLKIIEGIGKNDNLLYKWLPREKSANSKTAKKIREALELSPRQYRKLCSGVVTTETLMCAKKWEQINLSQVPSVASARYQKAFERSHPEYSAWKESLVKGNAKVNTSVTFPHDVYRMLKAKTSKEVVNATWKLLPQYIPEGVNILPIVDVSGSMSCSASGSLSCMDVSISLGAYIATKSTGSFKGCMLTFHTSPSFYMMTDDDISKEFHKISSLPWGGSTNFQKSFDLILERAVTCDVPQEDMPEYVLCLSDMQFDEAEKFSSSTKTNFDMIEQKYNTAGYKMPKLVFWNLNGGYGKDSPATAAHKNVGMVSGFSPTILKSVLSGKDFSPMAIMLETVMNPRYQVL